MKLNNKLIGVQLFLFTLCLSFSIVGVVSAQHSAGKIHNHSFQSGVVKDVRKKLDESQQILIVVSKTWESATAALIYYERKNGKLIRVSGEIPVNLGESGLGWGSGIVDFIKGDGPLKHEGDGRSPAGIFRLSYVFGYLPQDSLSWLNYPYMQLTKDIECVDDTNSEYYNTVVNSSDVKKDWKSSEKMRSSGVYYKYGIFIEHNSNPPISGCGSCIFIHVGKNSGEPTAGCTSLSEEEIIKLLRWLDIKKKPILIQLPEGEFQKIKSAINFE